MANEVPSLGEVWEDAEGTLMTVAFGDPNYFWVFGVAEPIPRDHPGVVEPLRRVFLNDGTLDEDFATIVSYDYIDARLRYPNGVNSEER